MALFPSAPEPTGKLPPQDWLTAVETQSVIDALQVDGTAVRFVGGCVRDALAKQPIADIDIATPDLPKTRSGKIMRRVIAAISNFMDVGDTTTLANPEVVEEIRKQVQVAKAKAGLVPEGVPKEVQEALARFGEES